MSTSPYPGLRPFHRDEVDIFFGRDEQVDQLLIKLGKSRFLAAVGSSGCGKSSLVHTGLLNALEADFLADVGLHWRIATLHPGEHPMRNLAEALVKNAGVWSKTNPSGGAVSSTPVESPIASPRSDEKPAGHYESSALLLATLRRGPLGLIEALREEPLPKDSNLLIVVDQFEEIIRFGMYHDPDEAGAFVALLLRSVLESAVQVYVVITMRTDYIGDCTLFQGLPEALNDGLFLVPRLTRDQRSLAITGPAKVFGGDVELNLVNRLLNDMGADPDQLPVLQHALMRLWTVSTKRGAKPFELRLRDYEDLGGWDKTLSNHADEVYGNLKNKEQRHIAEIMFRCLTKINDAKLEIRCPTRLDKIIELTGASSDEVVAVIDAFRHPECCFLMPPINENLREDSFIDISHESLIRQWQKLKDWVKEDAELTNTFLKLNEASQNYDKGVRKSFLDLAEFYNYSKLFKDEPTTSLLAKRYGEDFELAKKFYIESDQKLKENKEKLEGVLGIYQRRISPGAKLDEEIRYQLAKFLFVSEVLEGDVKFASHISSGFYWLLEEMWLQQLKILRAYFLWEGSETKSNNNENFFKVTNHIRGKLVDKAIKAHPSEFNDAKKYIKTYYLGDNNKLREAKADKLEELIRIEASRIYKVTGYTDKKKNWQLAETRIKQYCSGDGNKFWALKEDVFVERKIELINEQAYFINKITGYSDLEKNRLLAETYVNEDHENMRFDDESLKLSWLIREKAQRIYENTGSTDMEHNWILAEAYVRMFYENIIPAVELNDKEKVLQILKAFQYSKTYGTYGFLIKNCFEVALAIYFLNPETIQSLWNESKGEDRPESNVESVLPVNSWPQNFTVDEPINTKFWSSENRNEIRFKGVMLEVEKEALLEALNLATSGNPAQEYTNAIETLYKQSRLIHEETTL